MRGLILDFFGVMTTNAVEVIESFEDAERLQRGTFLRACAFDGGRDLVECLELGKITQDEWNVGYARLIGGDREEEKCTHTMFIFQTCAFSLTDSMRRH